MMPDSSQLMLGMISALLAGLWWSIRTWIGRLDLKLDRMEARQAQMERDCVTWGDLEKVNLKVVEHDRRITVIETTCAKEHGK